MIGQRIRRKSSEGRRPRPLRTLLIIIFVLEAIGLFTVFGLFASASMAGKLVDVDSALPYIGSLLGIAVLIMTTIAVSATVAARRRRSSHSSDSIAEEFGYQSQYHVNRDYPADDQPKKKEVYKCSYCGYGTDTLVGECPECGGPIITDN